MREELTSLERNGAFKLVDRKPNMKNKRLKHVDVKHRFIRQKVEADEVDLKYISSTNREADILTKGLSKAQLKFLKEIGLSTN